MYFKLSLYLAENSAEERVKYSSNKDMECILNCNYFLLKAPLGRESNTVPQGYGMYSRLKISLIENPHGESIDYSAKVIWNVFQACFLAENSTKKRVKYSSTRIWNVF